MAGSHASEQLDEYQEVADFLEAQSLATYPRSAWIKAGPVEVYLRAGNYHLPDDEPRVFRSAVGVANVVVPGRYRSRGHFRRFMQWLERRAAAEGYEFVRVEQVVNPDLLHSLFKHGYVAVGRYAEVTPVVAKLIKESVNV